MQNRDHRIDEMNDHAKREVHAEAKILQELSHPTIIKYFVTQLCKWSSLVWEMHF